MPSYTRGIPRDKITYVKANPKILYGFNAKDFASVTGVTAGDITAVGHLTPTAAAALTGFIPVFGASSPKPPRFRKKLSGGVQASTTQGSISTFGSYDAIATAQAGGWQLIKGARSTSLGSTPRSVTAIAEITGGALYCFPMNKSDFDNYGGILGLRAAATITTEAERNSLVRGTTMPRPGRAALELTNGSTFSSFYSVGAALTAGTGDATVSFGIQENERLLILTAPTGP